MRVVWGAALALLGATGEAAAEGHRAASSAIYIAETCLTSGDAAFEHSLQDGLAQADAEALTGLYSIATFECLGFAMEICETLETGEACLQDLSDWTRQARGDVATGLPDAVEGAVGYGAAVALARAEADTANCVEMTEAQRVRYCGVVSEGVALDDAYHAWRLARRAGAVPLVGHDPVDLEMIR